jgi:hypothetical protein
MLHRVGKSLMTVIVTYKWSFWVMRRGHTSSFVSMHSYFFTLFDYMPNCWMQTTRRRGRSFYTWQGLHSIYHASPSKYAHVVLSILLLYLLMIIWLSHFLSETMMYIMKLFSDVMNGQWTLWFGQLCHGEAQAVNPSLTLGMPTICLINFSQESQKCF